MPAVGTVIYSADGTTSAPPTVSDAASATNGDSSTDLVVAPSQPTPPTAAAAAPKKKARTSEGEIKYDENGEPLKPPAKRAKAKHPPKYATAEAEALPQAIPCEGSLTNDSNGAGGNGLLLSNALDVLASAALNSPPSAPLPAPSLVSSCDTSNSNDHGSVKALKRKIMGMGEELSPAIDNDGMNMEVDDASAAYA